MKLLSFQVNYTDNLRLLILGYGDEMLKFNFANILKAKANCFIANQSTNRTPLLVLRAVNMYTQWILNGQAKISMDYIVRSLKIPCIYFQICLVLSNQVMHTHTRHRTWWRATTTFDDKWSGFYEFAGLRIGNITSETAITKNAYLIFCYPGEITHIIMIHMYIYYASAC